MSDLNVTVNFYSVATLIRLALQMPQIGFLSMFASPYSAAQQHYCEYFSGIRTLSQDLRTRITDSAGKEQLDRYINDKSPAVQNDLVGMLKYVVDRDEGFPRRMEFLHTDVPAADFLYGLLTCAINIGNDKDVNTAQKAAIAEIFSNNLQYIPLPEGVYRIDPSFISETASGASISRTKELFFQIRCGFEGYIDVVRAGVTEYNEEIHGEIKHLLYSSVQLASDEDIYIPTQLLMLVGEGGTGKTTLLVQTAFDLGKDAANRVFLMQINSKQTADYFKSLERVLENEEGDVFLLADNPGDNPEIADMLFQFLEKHPNVKLMLSERSNRMARILTDIEHGFVYNYSKALQLVEFSGSSLFSAIEKINLSTHEHKTSWKRSIVDKMILSVVSDTKINSDLLDSIKDNVDYSASLSEIFIRVCLKYNKMAFGDISLKIPVRFVWDEWVRVFESDNGFEPLPTSIALKNTFSYIAALKLYGIDTGLKLLSNIVGTHHANLQSCLQKKLVKGTVEPAEYTDKAIVLKRDFIADLFFMANDRPTPIECLEELIQYLDDETAIQYEKRVFSGKYMRSNKDTPHESITIGSLLKLHKEFGNWENGKYLDILRDNGRLHSYDLAAAWLNARSGSMGKDELRTQWKKIIDDYAIDEDGAVSVWVKCFMECVSIDIEPPDNFYAIQSCIHYKILTDRTSRIEGYVENMGLNKETYLKIAYRVYRTILENRPDDWVSGMNLSGIMEAFSDFDGAESTLLHFASSNQQYAYKACNKTANFYLRRHNAEPKRTNNSRARGVPDVDYLAAAKKYFLDACKVAPEEEKPTQYCSLGKFYYELAVRDNTEWNCQMAKKSYDQALTHERDNVRANNGLAMLYANHIGENPYFNPSCAVEHFEKALDKCGKSMLLSILVPYGNLLYNIGELDGAISVYKKAVRCKGDRSSAVRRVEMAARELEILSELRDMPLKTVVGFDSLYNHNRRGTPEIILRNDIFKEEETIREIYSFVLQYAESDGFSLQGANKCLEIFANLANLQKRSLSQPPIEYIRIKQKLCKRCMDMDIRIRGNSIRNDYRKLAQKVYFLSKIGE